MKKVIFLVSGNGGNLRFLFNYLKTTQNQDFVIDFVIADRNCGALEFAKSAGIKNYLVQYDKDNSSELEELLLKLNPDIIVTNIHKILSESIVKRNKGKMINLHYSLLPAFKSMIGVKPIQLAIESGCKFVGATTHYVTEEVDSGEIISQSAVLVDDSYSIEKITEAVFRSGCLILLNSLYIMSDSTFASLYKNPLVFNDVQVCFSPLLQYNIELLDEQFWKKIKGLSDVTLS